MTDTPRILPELWITLHLLPPSESEVSLFFIVDVVTVITVQGLIDKSDCCGRSSNSTCYIISAEAHRTGPFDQNMIFINKEITTNTLAQASRLPSSLLQSPGWMTSWLHNTRRCLGGWQQRGES